MNLLSQNEYIFQLYATLMARVELTWPGDGNSCHEVNNIMVIWTTDLNAIIR